MFPFDTENDTIVLPPPEPFATQFAIALATAAVVAAGIIGMIVYRNKALKEKLGKII